MKKHIYLAIPLAIFLFMGCKQSDNGQKVEQKEIVTSTDESSTKDLIEKPFEPGENIFKVVDKSPVFIGGDSARLEYIYKNLKYPQEAIEKSVYGKVFLTFVIEKDGLISNVSILRGIGGGCDEEAIRIIENMPKWRPGTAKK